MDENNSKINKKVIVIIVSIICFIGILVAIVLFLNNTKQDNLSTINENTIIQPTTLTEESNNNLGMRFTFDVQQFEKIYLYTLQNNFSEYQNLLENKQIDTKFVKTVGVQNYELNQVTYNEQNELIKYFTISVQPESKESNYINLIQISAINAIDEHFKNISKLAEDNIFYAFMSVDNSISYEKAKNIYYDMSLSENNYVSNGNITFAFDINSDMETIIINIFPFNEEQYKAYLSKQKGNVDAVSEIHSMLSVLYDSYNIEFEPTDDQMQEMIAFYNSTDNFNSDTLLTFITEREWLAIRGNGNINNSETNNSNKNQINNNSTSSSKNTNTTSSNTSNKVEDEKIEIILNINLEQLINKNELAKEIKEKYPTIFIKVNIEDTGEPGEIFEYYDGGKSIPNTVTVKRKLEEGKDALGTHKNRNEKRKVLITMNNTSTMIVETTLFEGEIIFDKAGTYEIK